MTRGTLLVLGTIAVLLMPGTILAQARHFPLESADGLTLHHVTAEPAVLQGRRGLSLTLTEAARQRLRMLEGMMPEERARNMTSEELARVRRGLPLLAQLAVVEGLEFSNGVITVEVAGAPESGAAETARGFVGIAFRLLDQDTYDTFYLRPTNARAEDQERRNRTVQYMSSPDWLWPQLRQETPARYESYVDLVPGEWTKLRIEVRGEQARLYVHDNEQPTLIVNDVKTGAYGKGAVALWLGPGTVAHFRNLTVELAEDANQVGGRPGRS